MNIIKTCTSQARQFYRAYSNRKIYWTGTSTGAMGQDQLSKLEFERGRYLWAFPEEEKADTVKYAYRSAALTNSKPILVGFKTNGFLEEVHGHDCPAFDTAVSRIHIVSIEHLPPKNNRADYSKDSLAQGYMDKMNQNQQKYSTE
jgi:hypothetical protein